MTTEQIQQSAQLIDSVMCQANVNRQAHINAASVLKALREKAESANALQIELDAVKKELEELKTK